MSFTLCTSGAIVIRAGANADATASTSAALLEQFSNEAEGFINTQTKYDWVANYASVGANFKPILAEACAAWAGKKLIAYDMSGYTGRGYAESMINILHDETMRDIAQIKEDKIKTFMGVSNS